MKLSENSVFPNFLISLFPTKNPFFPRKMSELKFGKEGKISSIKGV